MILWSNEFGLAQDLQSSGFGPTLLLVGRCALFFWTVFLSSLAWGIVQYLFTEMDQIWNYFLDIRVHIANLWTFPRPVDPSGICALCDSWYSIAGTVFLNCASHGLHWIRTGVLCTWSFGWSWNFEQLVPSLWVVDDLFQFSENSPFWSTLVYYSYSSDPPNCSYLNGAFSGYTRVVLQYMFIELSKIRIHPYPHISTSATCGPWQWTYSWWQAVL